MTAPNVIDDNKARISRNVDKMRAAGAPDSEIESYIQSEGLTPVAHGAGRDIPEPEKDPYNYGSRDALLNGLSGGFSDELLSAAKTGSLFHGKEYEHELERQHRGEQRYSEAHPYANMGAEALGMAVPAALTGGINAAARLGVRSALGQAAANQGIVGAIYGAGNAGPGSRTMGAATGGVAGGVIGSTAHLGIKALQAAAELTPGINTLGRRLHLLPSVQDKADQLVLRRIGQDETTPAAIRARVTATPDTKPETLLDMGDENVTSLGKVAVNAPGTGRREFGKLVTERQANAPGRVSQDLQAAGMDPVDKFATADALIAHKKAAAKPLYENALMDPDPIDDPVINGFLRTPEAHAAFRIAEDMRRKEAAGEALRAGRALTHADYALPQIYNIQTGEITEHPDASTLHWMKLALDKMVKGYDYVPPGGTASQTNRLDKGVAAGFRRHIATLIPGYDQAAGQYATDQGLQDAFEAGTNFLKEDAVKSAGDVAAMTPGEKELYRYGAGTGVRRAADMAPDGSDIAKRVYGSPEKRAQIAASLDNDPAAIEGLNTAMARERRMAEVNRLQGGSQTQPMAIEGADAVHTLGWLARVAKNPAYGVANWMIRAGNGMTPEVTDALSARLLSGRGGRQELLSALDALERAQGPKFNKSGALASLIAAMTGSTAGTISR